MANIVGATALSNIPEGQPFILQGQALSKVQPKIYVAIGARNNQRVLDLGSLEMVELPTNPTVVPVSKTSVRVSAEFDLKVEITN